MWTQTSCLAPSMPFAPRSPSAGTLRSQKSTRSPLSSETRLAGASGDLVLPEPISPRIIAGLTRGSSGSEQKIDAHPPKHKTISKSFFALLLVRKRAFVGVLVGRWRATPANDPPKHLSMRHRCDL